MLLEEDIHKMVVEQIQLTNPRILFWHTPNSGKVLPQYRQKLLDMGMLPGVSDLLLATPPALAWRQLHGRTNKRLEDYIAAALELKSDEGKPTAAQLEFLDQLRELGWATAISYGYDESMKQLREWGYVR